jgi:FtsZ-binding cell division protein ZapB
MVMRVLLTDDINNGQTDRQIGLLQAKITELEEENRTLRQRLAVRERKSLLARHTMEELRALARKESIPVSGTKEQLLSRLVDKGIFNIDFY